MSINKLTAHRSSNSLNRSVEFLRHNQPNIIVRNIGASEPSPNLIIAPIGDVFTVTCVITGPPFGVTVAGEKPQEAPAGNPEQLNETAALNPFNGVRVREKEPL